MKSFRLSKYDPKKRDPEGRLISCEWTSVSDIGKDISGKILTLNEYLEVENAYLQSLMHFFESNSIDQVILDELEDNRNLEALKTYGFYIKDPAIKLSVNEKQDIAKIEIITRLTLRELIWCKISFSNKGFVHFGYDYYMYLGVPEENMLDVEYIRNKKLYIEEYISPYLEEVNSMGDKRGRYPL